jgi:o-succinylbenzoate synthase
MVASYKKHTLTFKSPSGTSRGILRTKTSWFLKLKHANNINIAIGECSIIEGLNPENHDFVDIKMEQLCTAINNGQSIEDSFFENAPSVRFAYEMAYRDMATGSKRELYNTSFTSGHNGIPINGLIWMGSKDFMLEQIEQKLEKGYKCLKLKVAAIDFKEELSLLSEIRSRYSDSELEIRVDANGGFKDKDALEKLKHLSDYKIHSIEQPIMAQNWPSMSRLIEDTPIDIALDEELIGIDSIIEKEKLITELKPHYIILKPSLVGGFKKSEEWIEIANKNDIKWWITSALESNIGLNAIAQWSSSLVLPMHYQGLGTGQLFENNIPSPLYIENENLYSGSAIWDASILGC